MRHPPHSHLQDLAEQIGVASIMTAAIHWHRADVRWPVGDVLRLMRESRFDQMPVFDDEALVGLARLDRLTHATATESIRAHADVLDDLPTLNAADPISDAIGVLARSTCSLVRGDDAIAHSQAVCGLLHFSDLNRHIVRVYLYIWLSGLEVGLSNLVRRYGGGLETWLPLLSQDHQVSLLGRCEYERRNGIELDPIEGTHLSALVNICVKRRELCEKLGYSKAQFDSKAGSLVELRHAVMHPVRSLVRSHDDVATLAKRLDDLRELVQSTQRALAV